MGGGGGVDGTGIVCHNVKPTSRSTAAAPAANGAADGLHTKFEVENISIIEASTECGKSVHDDGNASEYGNPSDFAGGAFCGGARSLAADNA